MARALRPDGEPSSWFTAIGPLRKGELWESTAVPELAAQARDLARTLIQNLPEGMPIVRPSQLIEEKIP